MNLATTLVVILLTGSMILQTTATSTQKTETQIAAPTIKSFTASRTSVCAALPRCSVIPDSRTKLSTIAAAPDGHVLTYSYSVPAGSIEGTGATVVWNLEKPDLGAYTAVVTVKDQKGNEARASVIVTAAWCALCDPPPCPAVSVSCPSEVKKGKPITFTANVKDDTFSADVGYEWWTSSGKIVKGQYEKIMTLEPSGFPFETVTATVTVRGFDPSCPTQASCTVSLKSE